MVKLIATDLDGTLLDGEKQLPGEIFTLIGELKAQSIFFAPASGRQYANLRTLFAPVADSLIYICENGALVKHQGETLFLDPVPVPLVKKALAAIRSLPHLYPMLCGVESAYIENRQEPFYGYARKSYTCCEWVEDLDLVVEKEPVCKIAVYDELPAAEHCFRVLPPLLPELRTILSGDDWCDVSSPTADKGTAIRFLRTHFGFEKEECVAFGDQMNDVEMLLECGHPYLTENAYPPLKERFPRTVPANTEGGVLRKIKEILKTGGNL